MCILLHSCSNVAGMQDGMLWLMQMWLMLEAVADADAVAQYAVHRMLWLIWDAVAGMWMLWLDSMVILIEMLHTNISNSVVQP